MQTKAPFAKSASGAFLSAVIVESHDKTFDMHAIGTCVLFVVIVIHGKDPMLNLLKFKIPHGIVFENGMGSVHRS